MTLTGPRLLTTRLFVPVFMPFAFAGLLCLATPLLGVAVAGPGGAIRLLGFLPLGLLLMGIALRPRVVRLDEADATVSIAWGLRWPLVYRRYAARDWAGFQVVKEFPVGVTPRSAGRVGTTALPPHWHLQGRTRKGKGISLGIYASEAGALALRKTLEQGAGWFGPEPRLRVQLSHGVGRTVAPSAGWRDEAFFKTHPHEAALYEQLGAAGSWRCLRGGNVYDADRPDELGRDDFDIPLLASNARLPRPWRLMRSLEKEGWVDSGPSAGTTPIAELARLEARFGWAAPMMVERGIKP